MLGTNLASAESGVALAQQQAAGLRALATLIEQNPTVAWCSRYSLSDILVPLIEADGDPRAQLVAFHAAAHAHGATVTVTNADNGCHVAAEFGPVAVRMVATAAALAGNRPPYPHYEPVAFGESAGGER
jgi:hypothetical protein